jgi:hypothetical protein
MTFEYRQQGKIHNQFLLNTHEEWGKALEESMARNLAPNNV